VQEEPQGQTLLLRHIQRTFAMTDYEDFDPPDYEVPPHQAQSDTSTDAAHKVAPKFGKLQRKVLSQVGAAGEFGFTCDELEHTFGWLHESVSPILTTLRCKRGVIFVGEGRRLTRRHHKAWVYKLIKYRKDPPENEPPCRGDGPEPFKETPYV